MGKVCWAVPVKKVISLVWGGRENVMKKRENGMIMNIPTTKLVPSGSTKKNKKKNRPN